MYLFVGILLFIALLFALCIHRRGRARRKVLSMTCEEKCGLLNTILDPFGFVYCSARDLISSRGDAWQRQAGYTTLFDRAAPSFYMVFDALPIYFDYRGRTWLIEFWKGQYGINTGAEVGIYYTLRTVKESELSGTLFYAVQDADRLSVSYTLSRNGRLIARACGKTWWLTVFLVGLFSRPSWLTMDISIRFPDCMMQDSFLRALRKVSPSIISYRIHGDEVRMCYKGCREERRGFRKIQAAWALFCNAFFCRLYRLITKPFTCTLDRLLYLYALLPFVLRRTLRHLKGAIDL